MTPTSRDAGLASQRQISAEIAALHDRGNPARHTFLTFAQHGGHR
ncbi:hypothetical protein KZZ52_43830 [Dactylosporangium sp. AC04546]|nr:hypothetical protein [Dactylosporangium sp. AC04546]WVK80846.1 hypothetical protein KZZ52_43830 [Dactylosporangium sp. AC04546]